MTCVVVTIALGIGACSVINQRPIQQSSSQITSSPSTETGKKTAKELRQQVLDYVHDTISVVGGTWALDTPANARVNSPTGTPAPWDPSQAQYLGLDCETTGPAGSQQFQQLIFGPAISDPAAAIEKVTAHWKKLGYKVRTVAEPKSDPDRYIEIAADLPNGAMIDYQASHQGSSILVESECSTDPSLNTKTK